jgi:hypothetical protein
MLRTIKMSDSRPIPTPELPADARGGCSSPSLGSADYGQCPWCKYEFTENEVWFEARDQNQQVWYVCYDCAHQPNEKVSDAGRQRAPATEQDHE